jgi:general secretion pathway protein C
LNHDTYLPSLAAVRDALVLRRWTAVARWLLVAVAAYAGALAVNAALAFWFDVPDDLPKAAARRNTASKPRAAERARDHSVIFERNLFGGEPIVVAAAPDRVVSADALDLRLLGTAQVDGRGFAVVEDVAGSRQDVFVVGESIFDGPTLVAVGDGNAKISVGGRTQTLEIAAAVSARGEEPNGAALAGGIRQTGANSFLVDRREVEHSIENLNKIATQMRAVPYLKDGAAIGFRVFNIRANSIFDRIGLKNGDVIQKVNGVDLDSPTKALALLEDVQTTEEIRVDLLRANAPTTLVYTVR